MADGTDRSHVPSTAPPMASSRARSGRGATERGRSVWLFVILAVFWLLLSGRTTLPFFILMVVSVGLVMALNPERPFGTADPSREGGIVGRLRATKHLLRYLAWLVWSVMKANVDVAYRILHPKLPIEPRLLVFRTKLREDVSRVLVANTITLTPGTVTIDLLGDTYLVHALHPETAGAVLSGELQNRVGPVFGDGPDHAPEPRWIRSYEEFTG
jgi:multicomponent Na+:H+ antiporter subunit E